MVLAWSITEVVRFATYTTSLLGVKLRGLEVLRYNLFYLLYPLGAGSEAALMCANPWARS
jgi:very-long-chain (3R)-3-hydroxyacyl-CoA dehydratase